MRASEPMRPLGNILFRHGRMALRVSGLGDLRGLAYPKGPFELSPRHAVTCPGSPTP